MNPTNGTLVLVVGPSGAGKDSVQNGARSVLAGDDRFVFARRIITRPPDDGGEDNIEVTTEAFAAAKADGAFSLSWRAHGLDYAIPQTIEDDLRARRCVVASVSRSVIESARAEYARLCVINITAPLEVLAERIARRGRENAASIRERLARADYALPTGDDVVTLENTGTVEEAVNRFVSLLRQYGHGGRGAASPVARSL